MQKLVFSTGNLKKFAGAQEFFKQYDITVIQKDADIDEIQGEDGEKIITDKVKRAFEHYGHPVIVSDHWWEIPGLNGFPGPYMKSMNQWFSAQNFIDLTKSLNDRRVFLFDQLAFADESGTYLFNHKRTGEILREPRGTSNVPCEQVVAMSEDNGLSIAEVFEQNVPSTARDVWQAWHDFAQWYVNR